MGRPFVLLCFEAFQKYKDFEKAIIALKANRATAKQSQRTGIVVVEDAPKIGPESYGLTQVAISETKCSCVFLGDCKVFSSFGSDGNAGFLPIVMSD